MKVSNWKVLVDTDSCSDHWYVKYKLVSVNYDGKDVYSPEEGWSYRRIDLGALSTHLTTTDTPTFLQSMPALQAAETLTQLLREVCNACMPPRVSFLRLG